MTVSLEWTLIRGSGLVAYAALAAATLWGLVLSLGILPKSVRNLTMVHEALSVGALVATLVHMLTIAFDDFVDFDAADVLVPGMTDWRPLAVALGITAFYGMVIVILTFYIRKQIGQSTWRFLHNLSFGVFLSALVHGITAGTDSGNPVVFTLYAGTGAAVVALVVLRVVMSGKEEPAPPRARPTPTSGPDTVEQATVPPAGDTTEAPRRPRIPPEALAAARAARSGDTAAVAVADPPATGTIEEAAPAEPHPDVEAAPKPRIPEHLLARARAAREAAGQEIAPVPESAVAVTEPVAAPADTDEPTPARKPRIPAEALARAAAMRDEKERGDAD